MKNVNTEITKYHKDILSLYEKIKSRSENASSFGSEFNENVFEQGGGDFDAGGDDSTGGGSKREAGSINDPTADQDQDQYLEKDQDQDEDQDQEQDLEKSPQLDNHLEKG